MLGLGISWIFLKGGGMNGGIAHNRGDEMSNKATR
jgi:hypothetical protein